LVDDGAGGVIIDYSPDGKALSVVKIDANGDLPWGEAGVLLRRPGNTRQIAIDGAGGVVIVCEELRYPEGAQPGEAFSSHHIYAQKIDSGGQFTWGEEGVLLYSTPIPPRKTPSPNPCKSPAMVQVGRLSPGISSPGAGSKAARRRPW